MRAKIINIPTFEEVYDLAPLEIKQYLDRCKEANQSPEWHPEGPTYRHIKIVYNRARNHGDINLVIAELFHDLGKADVTKPHPKKEGSYAAYGHEAVSSKLARKYEDWISSLGADPEQVYHIVKEHMRIKKFDEMRPSKREKLENDKWFSKYKKFTEFDNMLTLTDDELID